MTKPVDDDLPRDAWLGEALRHAPDTEARPAPAVRAAILREAREAVRPRRTAIWQRAWSLLGQPRFAGAFASLVVMVGAGALWWGRPLQEALPERQAAPAEAPKAEAPAASISRQALPPPEAMADRRAPAAPRHERAAKVAPPAAPPPPKLPPMAPVPVPAAPTARSEAASMPPAFQRQSAAPDLSSALARRRSGSGLEDLQRLRGEVPGTPGWAWERDDGPAHPANAALARWLERLSATLAAIEPDPNLPEASSDPGATLRLLRDGHVLHSFRIAGGVLTWSQEGGTTRQLPLTPAQAAELTEALARLAP